MSEAHARVAGLVEIWQATRAELRAIEQAEHPDLTDQFGRVWLYRSRDLYVHDGLIAATADVVASPHLELPAPGLADRNPNYAGLCQVCRRA